jgi:hypothetical protein
MLIAALGLALLWIGGLAVLAVTTANPPQINLAQFALARDVVQVRVDDADKGRCTVLRRWTPGVPESVIHVTNLDQTRARAGREYVLPLNADISGAGNAYRIATDPRRGSVPYIYAAGESMDRQLEEWFAADHRSAQSSSADTQASPLWSLNASSLFAALEGISPARP